ncbi:MAG: hypothetical protein JXQ29_08200 [Planctomycetes bacterium]|nr:hypothetical protein [Planctomycetota bacterium]
MILPLPFVVLVAIALAGGCRTGWDHRSTLHQLYIPDESGQLVAASTVKELSSGQCLFRAVLGPFGLYDPVPEEVPVPDPAGLGRTTILELSGLLAGNPALTAFALPEFSELALKAPFELTRAQAVKALGTALDRQIPPLAPLRGATEESAERIGAAVRELIGRDAAEATGSEAPGTLGEERRRELVHGLATTDYRSIENTRPALKALGLVARFAAGEPESMRGVAEEGIYRLSRTLCRLTLLALLATEQSTVVRGAAAEAIGAAREDWAERALLDLLPAESDPGVIRKVYRSLAEYRTSAVARALIAAWKAQPNSLNATLARRALLEFTREDLGSALDAWENRLAELGYLAAPPPAPPRAPPVRAT